MMSKWSCESCGERHKTKRELIDCLKWHVMEAYEDLDTAESQLRDLGVKEYQLS